MKSFHSRILVLFLSSLGFVSMASAAMPIEYLRPMKSSVSIGVRMVGRASVTFGGESLGAVAAPKLDEADINGNTARMSQISQYGYLKYDDGIVYYSDSNGSSSDGSRPAQGDVPATIDGRWQTHTWVTGSTGNSIQVMNGDYLAWDNTGYSTRNWSANNQSQVGMYDDESHFVEMSFYGSNRADGDARAKSRISPGIELQFSRVIKRYKYFEWGFNATVGIAEFNAKNRMTLKANAVKYTDRYQVLQHVQSDVDGESFVTVPGNLASNGNVETTEWILSGPSFTGLKYENPDYDESLGESEDNPREMTYEKGMENTAPLGIGGGYAPQTPASNADPTPVAGGEIRGYWQVKGVYYLLRVGPMIRVPIRKNFAASFSAGYLGAWVGSKMRFQEELRIDAASRFFTVYMPNYVTQTYDPITDIVQNNSRYISGMYADANFEWWTTLRTGFYVGAVYEKLGSYKQEAFGRTATVKLTNGLGFRIGIITRF